MVELRWDGKYTKEGKKVAPVRIALPFQTVETVNESAQERQKMLDFFSDGKDPEWRNRLIWGDKKYVLPSLLEEFAGKVNLIYIDPPFATGADFSFTAQVPDDPDIEGDQGATFVKEPSILEQKAYRDTWGRGLDSFLQWFYETAVMLRELLAEDGSIYVHVDYNTSHYAKAILDEVFGLENYVNEIIWKRTSAHSNAKQGARTYGRQHDTIFFYRKSETYTFNVLFAEYDEDYLASNYRYLDEDGRRYKSTDLTAAKAGGDTSYEWKGKRPATGRYWAYSKQNMEEFERKGLLHYTGTGLPRLKQYLDEMPGVMLQDLWSDITPVQSGARSDERVGYPTQKPEALLERIIKASSNEGDLVLDCFCGSGTTAAVAEKLGRRWITCDLGRFAIHTARKRLLGIPNVRPFTLQNLGKYERQAWQAAEFASSEDARLREARYRKFILDLYRAESITSGAWLHGVKLGRMVHVGAVDAPVTLEDVKAIARETWKRVGSGEDAPESAGVDILGWDFAFELNELGMQVAREAGVDVKFKKIPREVLEKKAVDQGDIKFFELAALSVDAKTDKKKVTLDLKDFIISPDDVPQEVMQAVTHWSQWVDYWAVDWDFKGDTFHNQWQSYRTKKQSKLELKASHMYEAPGEYTVLVKVIDLLGNDTTKAINIRIT
jgi:adenine-specific DNA-methyltransferase